MKNSKMKQLNCNKYFIFTLVLFTIIISGCSDNELKKDLNDKTKLLSTLKEFNKNYLIETNEIGSNNSNKGFWASVGKALTVAGADVVSAGAGIYAGKEIIAVTGMATGGTGAAAVAIGCGVVAGAGGSVAAYNSTKEAQIMNQLFLSSYDITYPINFKYLSNFGENHNKELFAILNNYDSLCYIYSLPENEVEVFKTVEWNDFTLQLNNSIIIYTNTSDINSLINSSYSSGIITSNMKDIYMLFFEVFNTIECDENVEDIVNFYIQEISNDPSLTLVEKESLIASFSVASESIYLWLNQLSNEE